MFSIAGMWAGFKGLLFWKQAALVIGLGVAVWGGFWVAKHKNQAIGYLKGVFAVEKGVDNAFEDIEDKNRDTENQLSDKTEKTDDRSFIRNKRIRETARNQRSFIRNQEKQDGRIDAGTVEMLTKSGDMQ